MVQNAIVKEIIKEGVVRVSLMRQMECGMHCDGACAGCSQKPTEEILALAENGIGESMLRLSVGLEDADDLIADLKSELDKIEVNA